MWQAQRLYARSLLDRHLTKEGRKKSFLDLALSARGTTLEECVSKKRERLEADDGDVDDDFEKYMAAKS